MQAVLSRSTAGLRTSMREGHGLSFSMPAARVPHQELQQDELAPDEAELVNVSHNVHAQAECSQQAAPWGAAGLLCPLCSQVAEVEATAHHTPTKPWRQIFCALFKFGLRSQKHGPDPPQLKPQPATPELRLICGP